MSMSAARVSSPQRSSVMLSGLLLLGFAIAVAVRVLVGGPGPARSPAAGLLFAACLVAMTVAVGTRVPLTAAAVRWAALGVLVLCAPVVALRLGDPWPTTDGFASWAAAVAVVAAAEELFLRGALYDAVCGARNERTAIVVGAVAFAALHVPLYGWHVVPLDLLVGLVLGELRRSSGTPAAPVGTHVGADLIGWFLR